MEPEVYRQTAAAEASHFWFRELRRIWVALLKRGLGDRPGLRILDAGCGAGANLATIERSHRGVGIDRSAIALALSRSQARSPLARGSVDRLPFRDSCFDAVLSTDVIYHRGVPDDVAALREFARVTKPGGVVILNLPAFESLRSSHDEAVHTARRYARGELTGKIRAAGLVPERVIYWNGILLIPSALFRVARRGSGSSSDIFTLPRAVNAMLGVIARIDAALALAGILPAGLSIAALARRPR